MSDAIQSPNTKDLLKFAVHVNTILKTLTSIYLETSSSLYRGFRFGKKPLAFDTIFAEGQRRYVESLSAYARQFLGRMDKPDLDLIEGLSPAISIEQKQRIETRVYGGYGYRNL